MIQPAGPGRHAMHDLLRACARELACCCYFSWESALAEEIAGTGVEDLKGVLERLDFGLLTLAGRVSMLESPASST